MRPILLLAPVVVALTAPAALAEPEEDLTRQAAMAERFQPFDEAQGSDWAPAFPFPFFRSVGMGDIDSVSLLLKPGAYTVVVLCNCDKIAINLHQPDGSTVTPARSNEQGAMFSLDVATGGEFIVATNMEDCDDEPCNYAIKAYRKK
jgi:hypothetical protein